MTTTHNSRVRKEITTASSLERAEHLAAVARSETDEILRDRIIPIIDGIVEQAHKENAALRAGHDFYYVWAHQEGQEDVVASFAGRFGDALDDLGLIE